MFFVPAHRAATPTLDLSESERGWTVKLDMPGVAKEDVQINVEGRRISVQAESQREEERKDGERIVWRERSSARYARSFVLPVEVDQADAQAKLENGVLTLVLPKRAARAASQITVQ
jgi:HSP20 family protein